MRIKEHWLPTDDQELPADAAQVRRLARAWSACNDRGEQAGDIPPNRACIALAEKQMPRADLLRNLAKGRCHWQHWRELRLVANVHILDGEWTGGHRPGRDGAQLLALRLEFDAMAFR